MIEADLHDPRLARRAPALLRAFNAAGVLAAADVHVAQRLAALAGEEDEAVVLACAFAVRGPRLGHVYADLATVRETATVEGEEAEPVDLGALPWPDAEEWLERMRASSLTGGPLRLEGSALYLDRYWREEAQIAADLTAFAEGEGAAPDRAALDRLFAEGADTAQRLAAAAAVLRRLAVVAGGPGTGKTTTVARIVALLLEQQPDTLVALAAPTGKAADRLERAVHDEARRIDVPDAVRDRLLALEASTLHRLLGWRPDSHSRFRHHRGNRLPHQVVVVDETSMVSLSLMARLAEAVQPDARLILVGDPGQLASIEAGAVLGDIVGPAADGLVMRRPAREALQDATGVLVGAREAPTPIGDGIVVLDRVHRFGGGIATVAGAVRAGDPVRAVAVRAQDAVGAVAGARDVIAAARAGQAQAALDALGAHRVLCAHRNGPYGVAAWMARIEDWVGEATDGFGESPWYPGRPLLVTENDYGLRLFNGDTGVVVAAGDGRVTAAFERRGEILEFSPARLHAVETVYAMTIHKSQGSQFGTAVVLLPEPTSRLLTRELLYTAVTRAREQLILAGTEESIRAAVTRPIARASGLRRRLWGSIE